MNEAYKQLTRCGALAYLKNVKILGPAVYADADLQIIDALKADKSFLAGIGHLLHGDVGDDRCDFRSIRGSFGKGSLQIVVSKQTWKLYADIDMFSPYDDVLGFFGHIGEVLKFWKRKPKETECLKG